MKKEGPGRMCSPDRRDGAAVARGGIWCDVQVQHQNDIDIDLRVNPPQQQ